jgi:hypothetical protein
VKPSRRFHGAAWFSSAMCSCLLHNATAIAFRGRTLVGFHRGTISPFPMISTSGRPVLSPYTLSARMTVSCDIAGLCNDIPPQLFIMGDPHKPLLVSLLFGPRAQQLDPGMVSMDSAFPVSFRCRHSPLWLAHSSLSLVFPLRMKSLAI